MKFQPTVVKFTLLGLAIVAPLNAFATSGYIPGPSVNPAFGGGQGNRISQTSVAYQATSPELATLEMKKSELEASLAKTKSAELDPDLYPAGEGACHLSCVLACGNKSDTKFLTDVLKVSDLREETASLCLRIDELQLKKSVSSTCSNAVDQCGPIKARKAARAIEAQISDLQKQIALAQSRATAEHQQKYEEQRMALAQKAICPYCDAMFKEPPMLTQVAGLVSALTPLGMGAMNMGMYAMGLNSFDNNYDRYRQAQLAVGAPVEMAPFWAGNAWAGVPYAGFGSWNNGWNGGGGFNPLAGMLGNGLGGGAWFQASIGSPWGYNYPGAGNGAFTNCFPNISGAPPWWQGGFFPGGNGGFGPGGMNGSIWANGGGLDPWSNAGPWWNNGNMGPGGLGIQGNIFANGNGPWSNGGPWWNNGNGGFGPGGNGPWWNSGNGNGNFWNSNGGNSFWPNMNGNGSIWANGGLGGMNGGLGGINGGLGGMNGGLDSSYWIQQQQAQLQARLAAEQAAMAERMQQLERQRQSQQSIMLAQQQYAEALQRLAAARQNAQMGQFTSGLGGGLGAVGPTVPGVGPGLGMNGGVGGGLNFQAGFSLN